EVIDGLARYGPVKALFASNAFHYMGMAAWKARLPEATLFEAATATARRPHRGRNVEFVDMPHYKTGEVLVKMTTPRGRAWYVTDIVMNIPVLPRNLIVKSIFRVTKSGP